MDSFEILLTVMIAGFGLNFGVIVFMWRVFDKRFEKIDQRFEKIEALVLDIDRRLCRIEGALSAKDCCVLKDPRSNEKAN